MSEPKRQPKVLAIHHSTTSYRIDARVQLADGSYEWRPLIANVWEREAVQVFNELREHDYVRLVAVTQDIEREGDANGVKGWWS